MIAPEELGRVGFLHNLGGPHLNQLAAMAEPKEYPAGSEIFRQGEDSP
jgi:CRP-like cAMP-binding protein